MELRTLRLDLAHAKSALRIAHDTLRLEQAQREQNVIDTRGGSKALGANAEDRQRALTIALGVDGDYQLLVKQVRQLEYQVDGIEALIADEVDNRRRDEARIRDKLADALMWNVGADLPTAVDDAFDDALASISTETLEAIAPKEAAAPANEPAF